MGLGRVVLFCLLVGCVNPRLEICGNLACPADKTCDGHGGCAYPEQLLGCAMVSDRTSCSYRDVADGECQAGLCVPRGCGNSVVTSDEICDDGNTQNGDRCAADCRSDETCGNGSVDPAVNEQCDDGNLVDGDGCQHDCRSPRCGDGVVDSNLDEACDDGDANSVAGDAACRPNCQVRRCGDGIVDPQAGEVCDDANSFTGDGCRPDCLDERCGNGVIDFAVNEQCDDGNATGRDGCSACQIEDVAVLRPGATVSSRSYPALAYDGGRQRVVMFGGSGTSETWEWDGASWMQMMPRHRPTGRSATAMGYDAKRHRIVLFGGRRAAGSSLDDTWEYDGVDWTQIQPPTKPSARAWAAMAFDATRGRLILFGGIGGALGTTENRETWEWTGTTWSQLTPAQRPPDASMFAMAYDAANKTVVLAGGSLANTWTWDGTTWSDRGQTLGLSNEPTQTAMAYDPVLERVVRLSNIEVNATWEWNGSALTWTKVTATSPQWVQAATFDAARRQAVAFGGASDITWLRDGSTWTQAAAWQQPTTRYQAAAVYDPLRARVVMHGGNGIAIPETWEWNRTGWNQVATAAMPPATLGMILDYDVAARKVMMFGGLDEMLFSVGEVWHYTGATWQLAAGGGPARTNSMAAYDAARDRLVVFGGRADDQNRASDSMSQWSAANGWTAYTGAKPPGRRNGGMAYDPRRQRVVMFGGGGPAQSNLGDLWEWDGTSWTDVTQPGPSARRGTNLVFNPDARATVLIGNSLFGFEDLWEWSGTRWRVRVFATALADSYRAAISYDPIAHALVIFGGRPAQQTRLLVYRPYVTTEACTIATLDYDKDGKPGCMDEDCWASCTPLCAPGTTCSPTLPRCGDTVCDAFETCGLCPGDCGTCPGGVCGDYACDAGETPASCPVDCP